MRVRTFLAACLGVAAVASLGGVLFQAVHGGTTVHRSVAYALWFAAAGCLVLLAVSGSRRLARRLDLPLVEGWVLAAASVLLTALGALVDALG